jgi:hypothetical protein
MPFLNYYPEMILLLNCILETLKVSRHRRFFVSCDTRFKQTIMDLSAKEGAQINIDLDVEK